MPHSERLEFAIETATQAAALTLRFFQARDFQTETKADGSAVTTADREAEELVRAAISNRFPRDSVLGEEYGSTPGVPGNQGTDCFRWIVDPIDGTASFIHGVPLFGTMLACERGGRIIIGVIVVPGLKETVYAEEGGGCWFRGTHGTAGLSRVSRTVGLRNSVACTTSLEYFIRSGRESDYAKLHRAVKTTRGWSDCYAFLLLATGRIDAVVEPMVKPWDVAAVVPIVREAGGTVTDFDGLNRIDSGHCIASNGAVHAELLEVLGRNSH